MDQRTVEKISAPKHAAADLKGSIDATIAELEEKHRLHRKIRFLLDIRGLLVINKLAGDYVEFGVYRGEMMYAAAKILSPHIRKWVGLDTFRGLPAPAADDGKIFVFEKKGFMASPKEAAARLLEGFDAVLIEGDFRDGTVREKFRALRPRISVLVIDCNWKSSVESAVAMSGPYLAAGSIVYIDDYFVAARFPNFNTPILAAAAEKHRLQFSEFLTYPPCGRAFITEKR